MRLRENEIHKAGAGTIVLRRLFDTDMSEARLFASIDRLSLACAFCSGKPPSQHMCSPVTIASSTGAQQPVASQRSLFFSIRISALSDPNG